MGIKTEILWSPCPWVQPSVYHDRYSNPLCLEQAAFIIISPEVPNGIIEKTRKEESDDLGLQLVSYLER